MPVFELHRMPYCTFVMDQATAGCARIDFLFWIQQENGSKVKVEETCRGEEFDVLNMIFDLVFPRFIRQVG
jgi:hypothetical protein